MRNLFARVLTAVLLVCLSLGPGIAAAEPLSLPADALKAFQAFDAATEQLDKARSAMVAIEAGEKPKAIPEEWSGVMSGYQAAAETIKGSPGPALPDASAYDVPLDRLRSCSTRATTLAKLEKQLKGLHAVGQRVSETRALLKSRLDAAHAADETRRYLVKTAAKLAGAPVLAEVFTWSWEDLETAVSKSISGYLNEIKRYQERMDRGSAEIKSRAATMAGHAETFGAAKDCLLAGHWTGSKAQAGTVSGLVLQLTISGASWSGNANIDGEIVRVRSVSIAGSNVAISFADGAASMKGTLTADGRTYRGWFSSLDGPGSFSLRKE